MAKSKITAKALSSYRVSSNGSIIPCTGIRKKLANKRAHVLIRKETDHLLDLIGVPE